MGQVAVQIGETGVEMTAAPVLVVDFVELRVARMVRARAGKACAGLAPQQAHLRRHWASLNKQVELYQESRRLGHHLSRVYWMVDGVQKCHAGEETAATRNYSWNVLCSERQAEMDELMESSV